LLVLVDFQAAAGPVGILGEEGLLCWRVHESMWAAGGQSWTMQKQAEAYAEGLAFAIKLWAGEEDLASRVNTVPDISALCKLCDHFEGSDPASELWLPKKCVPKSSHSAFVSPRDVHRSVSGLGYPTSAKPAGCSGSYPSLNTLMPRPVNFSTPARQRVLPALAGSAMYPTLLGSRSSASGTLPMKGTPVPVPQKNAGTGSNYVNPLPRQQTQPRQCC
jgi:hypothetical protein